METGVIIVVILAIFVGLGAIIVFTNPGGE